MGKTGARRPCSEGVLPSPMYSGARARAIHAYSDALAKGFFKNSPVERKIAQDIAKKETAYTR